MTELPRITMDTLKQWKESAEADLAAGKVWRAHPAGILAAVNMFLESQNAISWEQTCVNCGKLMDDNYAQYAELEYLHAKKTEAHFRDANGKCVYDGQDWPCSDVTDFWAG